jgi:hypothetical protein
MDMTDRRQVIVIDVTELSVSAWRLLLREREPFRPTPTQEHM